MIIDQQTKFGIKLLFYVKKHNRKMKFFKSKTYFNE